jgi:putative heme-binding domain-containing protein
VLPLPKTAGGHPLPPVGELLRRDGNPEAGRSVFFRAGLNSCATCHRVRGQGQWVGPDLSTIGTKYGKDELLRSILNPSAAIGYSYRSLVLAMADGRALTGLPVEESRDRLVIKTADGQRISLRPGDIEERKTSDLSLMPEGLAQTMSVQELVDLIAYLSSLRVPVSIVGQYHLLGPLPEAGDEAVMAPGGKVDLSATVRGPQGQELNWRRFDANAEGLADLTTIVTGSPGNVAYVFTPVTSPVEQRARLVVDTQSGLAVWLNGKPVISSFPARPASVPREVDVDLPRGPSTLLIRLNPGTGLAAQVTVVTTIVADQPVSFIGNDASLSAR